MSRALEDHDSPWKEALELFFQPFLQLLYPDIHDAIAWTRPRLFLDKELQKLAANGHTGRRHADKLVQVWFQDQRPCWLLLHVEVQGQRDPNFPERMFVYYHSIREHHGKAVISLAVLTDANPAYRPERFEERVAGSGVSFRFRAVKLLDFRDRMDELLASDNPFALLIAAQLTARLVKDGKQRVDSLIAFYRLAIRKQLSRENIVRLLIFLEWLVALPQEIEAYYTEQTERLKENEAMPYVSIWERHITEKGATKGRLEGRTAQLSRQLQLKFGDLSDELRQRLTLASEAELDHWAERVLFANTLDEVFG